MSAKVMLVVHAPKWMRVDDQFISMREAGFTQDRPVIPAIGTDENGVPNPDYGIYFMQEIEPERLS